MIAFALDWGWWTVPAAVAAVAGLYYWNVRKAASRDAARGEFLSVGEVKQALARGQHLLFAEVRSASSYEASSTTVHGAVRLHPARPLDDARSLGLKPDASIVAFCA